jgi:hypothetical protein
MKPNHTKWSAAFDEGPPELGALKTSTGERPFQGLLIRMGPPPGGLAAVGTTPVRRARTARSTAWQPGDTLVEFVGRVALGQRVMLALPLDVAMPQNYVELGSP